MICLYKTKDKDEGKRYITIRIPIELKKIPFFSWWVIQVKDIHGVCKVQGPFIHVGEGNDSKLPPVVNTYDCFLVVVVLFLFFEPIRVSSVFLL